MVKSPLALVVTTSERGSKITEPLSAAGLDVSCFRLDTPKAVPKLFRSIRETRPDVLIVDSLGYAGGITSIASTIFSVPCILRIRGDAISEHRGVIRRSFSNGDYLKVAKEATRYFSTKATLDIVDNYAFVSRYIKNEYGIDQSRVINTPCFMLLDDLPEDPAPIDRQDYRETILLSVMNMRYPEKVSGLLDGLESISKTICDRGDTTMLVAGDGPYFDAVKAHCENLPGDIRALGHVSAIKNLYSFADIFIHFSYLDAYPSTVLEAYANRTPVIANTKVGMVDQVNHGKTGYLVNLDNQNDVSKRLNELIDSPSLRTSMGNAGYRSISSNNTTQVIGEEFASYVQQVLSHSCN